MGGSTVADIVIGGTDSAGATILTVYSKFLGDHAVYRTSERVVVQLADDAARADQQKALLAPLNPLRGQISGLIDGWRSSPDPGDQTRAMLFDRRVADALCTGLEGSSAQAETLLAAIKDDIVAERTSRARVSYLVGALAATALLIFFACLFTWSQYRDHIYRYSNEGTRLWLGVGAGALGALFSSAIGIRSRQILTDLQKRENILDAILRIGIGGVAGLVLVALLQSKLVTVNLGSVPVGGSEAIGWLILAIVAFLAGFSERIVPTLLDQASAAAGRAGGGPANPLAGADPNRVPPGTGGGGAVPSPSPAPVPPDETGEDNEVDCCPADPDVGTGEPTHDVELPPASGGVEEPR